MKRIYKILLIGGGITNIVVAFLHIAMIFFGASAYKYFGAPAYFVQNSNTTQVIGLVVMLSLLFLFAGFYALSGAGLIKRLPGLNYVILVVGLIYTIRGAVVFLIPFPLLVNKLMLTYPNIFGMDRPLMLQDWVFSFVWLFVGLSYLLGWKFVSKR